MTGVQTCALPISVISFIEAAILSDPVGSAATGRIRRISYTGSIPNKTPDKLVCNFIVQIPDSILDRTDKEDILSMTIYNGAAPITISRIQFTKEICSPTAGLTTFNTRRAAGAKEKDLIDVADIDAGGAKEFFLNINNPKDNQYKYVLIQASGGKLGGAFGPQAMRNVY